MKKVATRALLVFGGDAAARLFNFLAIVHFGRVLAPQHFGYVVIGMTALQYAALTADLGLATVGMRETARPPDARRFSFRSILSLKVVLAVIALGLYEAALFLLARDHPAYTVLALYGLSVLPYAFLIEWYFQGKGVLAPVTVSRVAGGAVYIALVYALVHSPADTGFAPVAFGAGVLASSLVLIAVRAARRDSPPGATGAPEQPVDRGSTSVLLKQAAAVSTGQLFAQTVQLVPPLAAGWLLSAADAGQYGAAMKLLALLLMLDRVFTILFLPVVARRCSGDRERLNEIIGGTLRIVLIAGLSLSATLSVVAESLLLRIFGSEYAAAGPLLTVLSWFFVLTLLNSVFTFSLIGAGHDRNYATATMWSGTIAAVIIVAGTALAGLTGTAVAAVIAEGVIVATTYRAFRLHFSVRWSATALPALLFAVVFTGLCMALGLSDWWLAPLLWTVFTGLAFALRLLSFNDLRYAFRQ